MKLFKRIYFGVLAAAVGVVVFLCSPYVKEYNKVKNDNRSIREKAVKTSDDGTEYIDFAALRKINPDIAAWIKIPQTGIDNPVVTTEDNSFYLTHNIKKEQSRYGTLFFDARMSSESSGFNRIIYGHNFGRTADVMFSNLTRYLDLAYLKKHPQVFLWTEFGRTDYEVLSVREVSAQSDAFRMDFESKKDFCQWAETITGSSNRISDISHILTLSTCNQDGSRRVVVFCRAVTSECSFRKDMENEKINKN